MDRRKKPAEAGWVGGGGYTGAVPGEAGWSLRLERRCSRPGRKPWALGGRREKARSVAGSVNSVLLYEALRIFLRHTLTF